ncbi:conserved protein of unknown function (plasmid) [Rhodovastum atsumiense]|uniref:Uncharacterized protein n=1 Tax=Rhodovastum atsumiense TaxID=504468 RepID=A0A5M6IW75_9PROT|nr:hypothetical protein [Rhodovastum atsumiense]KAA5611655.1 hypothetical protein F1189_13930 [Rhodovastum atsumiense]CAH2606245.1 conserved protein of unknown function [Rhodovastum atsumiense]
MSDPRPELPPRVTVLVSGEAGSGRVRVMADIEVALRASGYVIQWGRWQDEREVRSEHWAAANSLRPHVTEPPLIVLTGLNERRR